MLNLKCTLFPITLSLIYIRFSAVKSQGELPLIQQEKEGRKPTVSKVDVLFKYNKKAFPCYKRGNKNA
jgi:hypothetical protein